MDLRARPSRFKFRPEYRVKKRSEFLKIQQYGCKVRGQNFIVAYISRSQLYSPVVGYVESHCNSSKQHSEEDASHKATDACGNLCPDYPHYVCGITGARLGITITRKVSKNATVRNKLKRRIREYYRLNRKRISQDVEIVVVALIGSAEMHSTQIHKELAYLFYKANIFADNRRRTQDINKTITRTKPK